MPENGVRFAATITTLVFAQGAGARRISRAAGLCWAAFMNTIHSNSIVRYLAASRRCRTTLIINTPSKIIIAGMPQRIAIILTGFVPP
jgi:hypothetical protein